MKIALAAKPLWPLPTSKQHTWAVGMVMAYEADGLVEAGHEVTVYAAEGSKVAGKLVHFGMLPYNENRPNVPDPQPAIREYYYINEFYRRVIVDLRKNPVDILHLHDYRDYPIFQAADLNIPMVATIHGDYAWNFERFSPQVLDSLSLLNLISLTKPNHMPPGAPEPVGIVPNTFDTSRFDFVATPRDRLVFVSRITRGKGADLAIEAAKRAGVVMDIYGGQFHPAGYEDEFKLALAATPKVNYVGRLSQADIEPAFDAKAFIFPIREPEGFPLAVLESMSCGTPVITTDVGGMSELVQDGVTGFVVPAGDVDALAKAIGKIGSIDRAACRRYVQEYFNAGVVTQQHIEVFQNVIAGHGRLNG